MGFFLCFYGGDCSQFVAYYLIWILLKISSESVFRRRRISTIVLVLFISHGLLYLAGT